MASKDNYDVTDQDHEYNFDHNNAMMMKPVMLLVYDDQTDYVLYIAHGDDGDDDCYSGEDDNEDLEEGEDPLLAVEQVLQHLPGVEGFQVLTAGFRRLPANLGITHVRVFGAALGFRRFRRFKRFKW